MILFSLSGFSQTKIKPSQISNATKQSFKEVLDINKLETSLDSTNTVLSTKIDSTGISSSLDEFYNKTQSNARFINEDGDTITGIIYIPTAAAGTNTDQAANLNFVNSAKSNVTRLAEIGSTIKTLPFGYSFQSSSSAALTDGTAYYILQEPTYKATVATGIKCLMGTQGAFTEDNFCGAALVEVNGDGTYSAPVAISNNLPGQFKLSAQSTMTFPFTTPYTMNPNKLYAAVILYNSSAQTTAPQISVGSGLSGNLANLFSPTIAKIAGLLTSQATIPATSINISSLTLASNPFLLCIY